MRGIQKRSIGEGGIRTKTLREEREQSIILCKNCLLGQACDKPCIHINFDL